MHRISYLEFESPYTSLISPKLSDKQKIKNRKQQMETRAPTQTHLSTLIFRGKKERS